MHFPLGAEIAEAVKFADGLDAKGSQLELNSPPWRQMVWAEASVRGWISVAQSGQPVRVKFTKLIANLEGL